MRAAALLLALVLATGCGAARVGDPGPRGTLRFSGTPAEALVEVDDRVIGSVAQLSQHGLLLRPGPHRIIVRHDDFFPLYAIVEIREGQVEVLAVALQPEPE